MQVTLPFTCKQLEKFANALWFTTKWITRIGLLASIGLGIYYDMGNVIVISIIFSGIAWFVSISLWVEDDKIKCKCDKESPNQTSGMRT